MTKNIKRFLWWAFVVVSCLIVLIAIFVSRENSRGRNAWEKARSELEAKGEVLDWKAYVPAPVPDDQNIFKAPKMAEWFQRKPEHYPSTITLAVGANNTITFPESRTNELSVLSHNNSTLATITTEIAASNYLAWSDQIEPDFNFMRNALKRPLARMDGDYERPFETPTVHFVAIRSVAQTLAQRAKCHLLLHQPDEAVADATMLNDLRRLLDAGGPNKAATLVSAMINVAIAGMYLDVISDGMEKHLWRDEQLILIQKQLDQIKLLSLIVSSVRAGRAGICEIMEKQFSSTRSLEKSLTPASRLLMLRGWIYQNMATIATMNQEVIEAFDLTNSIVLPAKLADYNREVRDMPHDYRHLLAAISVSAFDKAAMVTAFNQTKANEAFIACALERYRLARNDYPETLGELIPQFIEKIPHDIIGGKPLEYHRTNAGKFLLYSIGWNGTDDGGQTIIKSDGTEDHENGDWVWPPSASNR